MTISTFLWLNKLSANDILHYIIIISGTGVILYLQAIQGVLNYRNEFIKIFLKFWTKLMMGKVFGVKVMSMTIYKIFKMLTVSNRKSYTRPFKTEITFGL